jgi:hypothetical protein
MIKGMHKVNQWSFWKVPDAFVENAIYSIIR